MKLESDVASYFTELSRSGLGEPELRYRVACYESCVPRAHWNVSSRHVSGENKQLFDDVVLQYVKRWRRAYNHGYSLLLLGDNGVGKTMFTSFVLTQMLKRGVSTYYTTLPRLDTNVKRGFKSGEHEERLEQMLESEFVAIDELGKESFKADSYLFTQLELVLKQRYDDLRPTILCANLDYESFVRMYGSSIESMVGGRYMVLPLEGKDKRPKSRAKMRKDLGIE